MHTQQEQAAVRQETALIAQQKEEIKNLGARNKEKLDQLNPEQMAEQIAFVTQDSCQIDITVEP